MTHPGLSTRIADIVAMAQMACLLEVSTPKPGNVSPGHRFRDVEYRDFVASALALGEPLLAVAERPLGATIRLAIEATRRWTQTNTNLGIVLLLTPLVRAAADLAGKESPTTDSAVRRAVEDVLANTTLNDARDVYAAIRLASPGGLGSVPDQDVSAEPTVDLQAAMRLAAHRDTIAREYVTGYGTTFEIGVPAARQARADGLDWDATVMETFLEILATTADSHIARRAGDAAADEVLRAAGEVRRSGGVRTDVGRLALQRLDQSLREPSHARNPGTTADLTAAALFVVLVDERTRTAERTRP